ncbi:hypothetical protein AVEN_235974-1 [Araneus ventricosus]|uniref:Tc1-like transposase DDE domain-containing protein n=1 Tax=Araneus ventricosus TaxID=182803 RepID=A0A4Y2QW96_ARAVE|nr:hypothetical protein AVEN_235974-1 [Araneus ventricosus]
MQDGAPPHIAYPFKSLLSMHFEIDRIISLHFPTNWPPKSLDLNPCDFWLWGYLKHAVFCGLIAHLAELMTRIAQHVHNISTVTLRSVVEHAICRFELMIVYGG